MKIILYSESITQFDSDGCWPVKMKKKYIFFNSLLLAPNPNFTGASLHIQNFLMPAENRISWGSSAINSWDMQKLCNCGVDNLFTNLHPDLFDCPNDNNSC